MHVFCEYILNGFKLNFKQDDVMEGSWQQKMILSILTLCNDDSNDTYKEGMEYKRDNDMVEIIQPTKIAKGKPNAIIDELIWTKETIRIANKSKTAQANNAKRTMNVMLNVMVIVQVEKNAQIREFRMKCGNQWRKR